LNLFIYSSIVCVSFIAVLAFLFNIWALSHAILWKLVRPIIAYLLWNFDIAFFFTKPELRRTAFFDWFDFSPIDANLLNAWKLVIYINRSRFFKTCYLAICLAAILKLNLRDPRLAISLLDIPSSCMYHTFSYLILQMLFFIWGFLCTNNLIINEALPDPNFIATHNINISCYIVGKFIVVVGMFAYLGQFMF